jgi:hypothetical protein
MLLHQCGSPHLKVPDGQQLIKATDNANVVHEDSAAAPPPLLAASASGRQSTSTPFPVRFDRLPGPKASQLPEACRWCCTVDLGGAACGGFPGRHILTQPAGVRLPSR